MNWHLMATSENLEDWQSITLYEENKWHLAQISDVSGGFRRLPNIELMDNSQLESVLWTEQNIPPFTLQ